MLRRYRLRQYTQVKVLVAVHRDFRSHVLEMADEVRISLHDDARRREGGCTVQAWQSAYESPRK